MGNQDLIVLVDKYGRDLLTPGGRISTIDKIEAHRRGLMHRAVSVFVFNAKKELLLQRRAPGKYHSPGRWSNTCCTHSQPGEAPLDAAQRRLAEEMGLVTPLAEVFTFSYKSDVGNGLIENEFDHVFFGDSNTDPEPNPVEVSEWNWVNIHALKRELVANEQLYSAWLKVCIGKVVRHQLDWDRREKASDLP